MTPAALLRAMFDAAVGAARPADQVPRHLPPPPRGRTLVLGAGKASAAMAQALESCWQGPLAGLVVTAYGHAVPCRQIRIVEAAHPVPDAAGEQAAREMLTLAQGLTKDDLVIGLFSGGGSALLPLPLPGIALADKQTVARQLLRSGATIHEINTVRRHLSAIKGGRLAAACHPARVHNLVISDVPGDDPADIASGPTVPAPASREDAASILRRHAIAVPATVQAVLATPWAHPPTVDDSRLANVRTALIATPQRALEAAAAVALAAGVTPYILGDDIEGEARTIGTVLASMARQAAHRRRPFAPPCVLLSGGEASVTVRGTGQGGRNVECLLSLAIALDGLPQVHALAADTDGVDGALPVAGAYIGPDTLERARERGMHARAYLDDNNAHGFFGVLNDAVVTGPTLTNVNDFRAVLVR